MKWIRKIMSVLILLSGLGHLGLGIYYDNQGMFIQMMSAGVIYLLLALLVWKGSHKALFISAVIMFIASIGSLATLSATSYPVQIILCFIGLNGVVVSLSALYFLRVKFVRELSKL